MWEGDGIDDRGEGGHGELDVPDGGKGRWGWKVGGVHLHARTFRRRRGKTRDIRSWSVHSKRLSDMACEDDASSMLLFPLSRHLTKCDNPSS